MQYVRFVVGTNREKARHQLGVIASLVDLKNAGALPDYEVAHIEEIFAWLESNLPCPPFSTKQYSFASVCWFKDSAQGMISKFRELVAILEQHDYPVRMLRTERPGMILYEDEFQVLAQSHLY